MRTNLKRNYRRIIALLAFMMILVTSFPAYAKAESDSNSYASRYITMDGRQMHVLLYGDVSQTGSEASFTDKNKTSLVMLPGLGLPSPHMYFKPLAQALAANFNVVIIEPFGYGLSDTASSVRSVENINNEFNEALDILDINKCVLLVHSISGVYGLNFVLEHSEKVKGFISIDNTVYDDEILGDLAMEQEYIRNMVIEFGELRSSFSSVQAFQLAIAQDPVKYGASLPEITGYTYPEGAMEEYSKAYSLSCNESSLSEIDQMGESILSIKNKKFPDSLPVLMMIASANLERFPAWETGHRDQLNPASANHELYILEGDHYIWYTNLSGIVEKINTWQTRHQF